MQLKKKKVLFGIVGVEKARVNQYVHFDNKKVF